MSTLLNKIAKNFSFEVVLESQERNICLTKILKTITVLAPTYPTIMSLVKKFDVIGTVEDLLRLGRQQQLSSGLNWWP